MVADSRSLRLAPTTWVRSIDGGKLVKGIKLCVVCNKHGSLLDLELHPANTDDRAGILPTLPRLAALGFHGDLLGDSGFRARPSPRRRSGTTSTSRSRPAARGTGASCRAGSGGSSNSCSLDSAATAGLTSCTIVCTASSPRTS